MPTPMDEWFIPRPKDRQGKAVEACLQQLARTKAQRRAKAVPAPASMSLDDFAAAIEAESKKG